MVRKLISLRDQFFYQVGDRVAAYLRQLPYLVGTVGCATLLYLNQSKDIVSEIYWAVGAIAWWMLSFSMGRVVRRAVYFHWLLSYSLIGFAWLAIEFPSRLFAEKFNSPGWIVSLVGFGCLAVGYLSRYSRTTYSLQALEKSFTAAKRIDLDAGTWDIETQWIINRFWPDEEKAQVGVGIYFFYVSFYVDLVTRALIIVAFLFVGISNLSLLISVGTALSFSLAYHIAREMGQSAAVARYLSHTESWVEKAITIQ
ncbi:MAG: hypothetical protein HY258_12035 [Chloroflexi bacterium]|nr:hypothetical protein [Chloroflexota bacterium]